MSADTLSQVLRAVRLRGAVFFTVQARGTWVTEAPAARDVAAEVFPGAGHVMEYHLMVRGRCFAGIAGQEPVALEAGDAIVFPQGDAHTVSSAPGMRGSVDLDLFHSPAARQLPIPLKIEGDGSSSAELVCGFFGLDARPFNPLLSALPRVLHVRPNGGPDGLMGDLVRFAVGESESRRPGADTTLARLSELLFIEVVRRNIESLPDGHTGWLAGLRDEHVGRALACLHDRPAHYWTLDSLAKEAGVSRSTLADRFAHLVGVPAMQYLAQWRMQLATGMLAGGAVTLAEVADAVGYGSEAAFSRAFKKVVGLSPAHWRQQLGAQTTTAPG